MKIDKIYKITCNDCLNEYLASSKYSCKHCMSKNIVFIPTCLPDDNQHLEDWIEKRKPVFGNSFSLMYKKVYEAMQDAKELDLACTYCGEFINSGEYSLGNGDILCDDCYDESFTQCENCNTEVSREEGNYFHDTIYCDTCYFKELQSEYDAHSITNEAMKKIAENNYHNMDITELYFRPSRSHSLYSITKNRVKNSTGSIEFTYRCGSFTANHWFDIGDKPESLLKAIDYHFKDDTYDIEYHGCWM